ncbi:sulfotransferase family protein [Candidatus Nitrotoga sp. 1052]|uniref:sulfotransferase family protein n=1 Tax=Candidatus Nitrotoga sp. 1052 TaxID=2886964 RepID=UPI001EF526A0|nr:sulfotransferase [Candidatus Nitrotoga sp. 1052]
MRRLPVERPVFVIGCSRAGTTLVYKTFSESKNLGTLQRETHDFWTGMHPLANKHWATHALGTQDATQNDRDAVARYFYAYTGKTRFVDKNNQNGLCVPYLYTLFPDAHFVYVKRNPGDNLHSLIEGWGKPEEFATWSSELKEKVSVDNGRYIQWCFFLSNGWRDYLDKSIEEVCAFQYRAINEEILAAKKRIPAQQWTEVFYEDLVRDPVAGFRQAFEQCGLTFTHDLEQHCANVLSTPYNAFSEIRLDKWKDGRNCDRVERVLPEVAAVARAMGYKL